MENSNLLLIGRARQEARQKELQQALNRLVDLELHQTEISQEQIHLNLERSRALQDLDRLLASP
jgi:hypothetical protein